MSEKILITGIGLITPIKPFQGVNEFWHALCSGQDIIKKTRLPLLEIAGEWPMAEISLSCIKQTVQPEDKFQYLMKRALNMAIEDANLKDCSNIGFSMGTVLGNMLLKEKNLVDAKKQKKEYCGEQDSLSNVTLQFSSLYNLNGPKYTVSTACTSGTDAIGIAVRSILSGKTDIMIAGGADTLSDFAIIGFHALQAITTDKVRPFDKNRSGLALGEGASFVVLESGKSAAKRNAKVYGRVIGYASRADANHLTGPHREGRGLAEAIDRAMDQSGVKPGDINYINAHGTGTVYNDLMETKAIKRAFGRLAYDIPISSTKSMLGHSMGAAGAIEAICCLLAIKSGIVPPTINFQERDPYCDLDYTPNIARNHTVKMAMSLSAGFGGQNSAIILGGV